MKNLPFNKRKVLLFLFHICVIGMIGFCFLKFPEEVIELKNQIRAIIYPGKQDTTIDFSEYPAIEHSENAWYESVPLIYHGGGGINGLDYTNSKEALEQSLEAGQRFIEIDFLYTADTHLVCAHYWHSLYDNDEIIPTLEEFKELKIFGKYSSMTAEELIQYMVQYPDLYIIIDTKEENYNDVIQDLVDISSFDTNITDRFIIQLYEENTKAQFQEMYPFKDENFLFTTYKFGTEFTNRIMNICYEENIAVVAIPYGLWEQETIEMFRSKNFIIYEYTVNRPNRANASIEKGINGFYTDYLTESDLKR